MRRHQTPDRRYQDDRVKTSVILCWIVSGIVAATIVAATAGSSSPVTVGTRMLTAFFLGPIALVVLLLLG